MVNNDSINLEENLHSAVWESGNRIEQQYSSIKVASV